MEVRQAFYPGTAGSYVTECSPTHYDLVVGTESPSVLHFPETFNASEYPYGLPADIDYCLKGTRFTRTPKG